MKKIAILGGTFNPIHKEHIRLARQAVIELGLDELLVMPTFLPPHKNVIPIDGEDRLNMLKFAFKDDEKITVSDFEIQNKGKSYTYLTVEHFKAQCDCKLYFIVGGDMLTDFKTWKYPERILSACDLCVFDREDYFTDYQAEREYFIKTFGKEFIKLGYVGKKESSTKIRIYNALGLDISGMTDPAVVQYIKQNDLYNGDKYTRYIKENLPEKRRIHTASVVETAMKKVKELNLDSQKVFLSALLHDCAKYLDPSTFPDFKLDSQVPKPVVHAFLGAYVAEKVLGITDEEILDAIKYHTSGKANMSKLAKLIFLADMVEENRTYEGVERLRDLYEKDFDLCFKESLAEELIHLTNKGQPIYIETINAYDYYVGNSHKGE